MLHSMQLVWLLVSSDLHDGTQLLGKGVCNKPERRGPSALK